MIRLATLIAVLLVPATALGQEAAKQCVENKPDHCTQPLAAGQAAPFDGLLYTPQLALDHAEKAHTFDQRLSLELKRVRGEYEIKLNLERQLREIERSAAATREQILRAAIEEAAPPWYERPAFIIPLTMVITAAAGIGAIAVSAELGKVAWAR